jgi:DNA-binding transcriptional MocR family regulator
MGTGNQYSQRVRNLHPSPIREILAVIDRPGMISFAGGLPAPETFPSIDVGAMPASWLQYGPSEGEPVLRARIAAELATIGLDCAPEQVLVLSGSQQGIDLVGKLFVDEGTTVAVESPTYLAALQVFRFMGARFATIERGDPAAFAGASVRPAFAYAIPTFQNPTGRCYDAGERDALAQACDAAGVPLFEDDPYRDLVYDACDRTPVCARLSRASWVYQGSFSKSFAPGLRLGFLAASPDLVPYLVRLKQAADLHSNRVSQWLVLQQLDDPARGARLAALAQTYRSKRDAFAHLLQRHLGGLATWEAPPGGLFFWLTLNSMRDTRALLAPAIERGVAFMPGEPFYADGRRAAGALRLNFSHASEAQADKGLQILAELLREPATEPLPVAARADALQQEFVAT